MITPGIYWKIRGDLPSFFCTTVKLGKCKGKVVKK